MYLCAQNVCLVSWRSEGSVHFFALELWMIVSLCIVLWTKLRAPVRAEMLPTHEPTLQSLMFVFKTRSHIAQARLKLLFFRVSRVYSVGYRREAGEGEGGEKRERAQKLPLQERNGKRK